jgi:hypothetical protein
MTILVSPGVDVQILDQSFYGGAGPGTVPLIVIATANNKLTPGGTDYAPLTSPVANPLYLATSQRDLVQNYGNPTFQTLEGTPLHGSELNEYGLHAAYSYLGIANRAYILRADIDLAQLAHANLAPTAPPAPGTYWLDTSTTEWGLFKSNGNLIAGAAWVHKRVRVAYETDTVLVNSAYVPKPGYGLDGDYAVVVATHDNKFYEKIAGSWYALGSTGWKAARPTVVSGSVSPASVTVGNSISINTGNGPHTVTFSTGTGTLANVVTDITAAAVPSLTAAISNNRLVLTNTAGGDIAIANVTGTPLTVLGITAGTTKGNRIVRTSDAQYPAGSASGDVWIKGTSPNRGAKWDVKVYSATTQQWTVRTAPFFVYDSTLNDGDTNKDLRAFTLGVPSVGNVYVAFDPSTGVQVLRRWDGTMWTDLTYVASAVPPSQDPEEGTLWYNADFHVDVMVGTGQIWQGYRKRYPSTDPKGVILSGSEPITQSDDTALVDYDLWIDTSDLENYPALYRYDETSLRWKRVDLTDQTTPFGIVFADARENAGPTMDDNGEALGHSTAFSELMSDMLVSDYVDPDAPQALVHPDGMLLFNTRFSTYNVKEWQPNYFKEGHFDPETNYGQTSYSVGEDNYLMPPVDTLGRWVTASGNRYDGAPWMGRKAQRQMIVRAMQAVVTANEDVRSEVIYYNLIAAPGYPELMDEMGTLNLDQKEVSFIIGDTPARLKPNGTAVQDWATNAKLAVSPGDEGLASVTSPTYTGLYYPWGLSTNLDGFEIMVPPSTIALRTYAYNDQVAYPWFAPAGFQRGMVSNATSVGYLTSENEYKPVHLNQGQRDVLYLNKINPIAFIANRGLVVYGQKTLHPLDSALNRVNVARLANYLKFNLDLLMKPFLFEQNDQQTRDSAKLVTERFLTGLITLRALEDFAVLCDESNNTPERRDRNELWVDILIKPIKAIEFIYVPVRVLSSAAAMTFPTARGSGNQQSSV